MTFTPRSWLRDRTFWIGLVPPFLLGGIAWLWANGFLCSAGLSSRSSWVWSWDSVLYNVLAAVLFPFLGQVMHLDVSSFGLWAGTAINDTSSVVAASTSFDAQMAAAGLTAAGTSAAAYAVVVKLTRSLMIVPLAVFQQWFGNRQRRAAERTDTVWWRLVPPFLVWFLLAQPVH